MSSMNNLSVDGEFRYIVTWFTEWSVLQREDFVPVLVAWLTHHDAAPSEAGGVYINGVTNSVANAEINDKPMSLFQCRIKLFNEWSPKWPLDFKYKLKEKIIEIDAKVGEKIISEIKGHSNGNNGIDGEMENGSEDVEPAVAAEENGGIGAVNEAAAQPIVSDNGADVGVSGESASVAVVAVEATEEAVINADDNLAAVLNNETPVDDDDDDDGNNDNNVEAQSAVAAHAEEPAEPVAMQQTHDEEEPVAAATAVTVANSAAEVPSIA